MLLRSMLICLQGSTNVTRRDAKQAGASSNPLPPAAAQVAIDTPPGAGSASHHQPRASALHDQRASVAAAAIGKPDGTNSKGVTGVGASSSSCIPGSPFPRREGAIASAAMPGTAAGSQSADSNAVTVSMVDVPAASLTVAEWSPGPLHPSSTHPAATSAPACPGPHLSTLPTSLTTQANILGITALQSQPYTAAAGSADQSPGNNAPLPGLSRLARPRRLDIHDSTAAATTSSGMIGAQFSPNDIGVRKVPQLLLSTLQGQHIASSFPEASLHDSPRPGLKEVPGLYHPTGAAASAKGLASWATGRPMPDSPRPAPRPSLPLSLGMQDAEFPNTSSMGLSNVPHDTPMPDFPRLSLPQSMRAIFSGTSAKSTSALSHQRGAAEVATLKQLPMPPSREGPVTPRPLALHSLPSNHVGAVLHRHSALPAGEPALLHHDFSLRLPSTTTLANTASGNTSTSQDVTLPANCHVASRSVDTRVGPAQIANLGRQGKVEPLARHHAPHLRVELGHRQALPWVIDLTNDDSDDDEGGRCSMSESK